jgi:hypothetical protein
VYIGIIVRNEWCPKGGEIAIYRPVCGQCVARDSVAIGILVLSLPYTKLQNSGRFRELLGIQDP